MALPFPFYLLHLQQCHGSCGLCYKPKIEHGFVPNPSLKSLSHPKGWLFGRSKLSLSQAEATQTLPSLQRQRSHFLKEECVSPECLIIFALAPNALTFSGSKQAQFPFNGIVQKTRPSKINRENMDSRRIWTGS